MKKNNRGLSSNVITIILVVIAVVVGIGFVLFNKGKDDRSIKDPDSYETQSFSGLSIKVPDCFEDTTSKARSTYGNDIIAWYECDVAFVCVSSEEMPSSVKPTLDFLTTSFENMEIDGEKMNPVNNGKYVLTTYKQDFYADSDKDVEGYYLDAYFVKDNTVYCVEAACAEDKYYDYKDYMIKWIESFSF